MKDMLGLVVYIVGMRIALMGQRRMADETRADVWQRVVARLDADTKARLREALGELTEH
jgi:hypothetical protein